MQEITPDLKPSKFRVGTVRLKVASKWIGNARGSIFEEETPWRKIPFCTYERDHRVHPEPSKAFNFFLFSNVPLDVHPFQSFYKRCRVRANHDEHWCVEGKYSVCFVMFLGDIDISVFVLVVWRWIIVFILELVGLIQVITERWVALCKRQSCCRQDFTFLIICFQYKPTCIKAFSWQ